MDNRGLMRAAAAIAEGRSMLDGIKDKLQEEFDEKSEKWQESDKGQEAQEAIELLDDLSSRLEDIESEIDSMKKD